MRRDVEGGRVSSGQDYLSLLGVFVLDRLRIAKRTEV